MKLEFKRELFDLILMSLIKVFHSILGNLRNVFFPTCQVRVVRFYVSCLLLPACLPPARLPPASFRRLLPRSPPLRQLRSTVFLPDLNHDHPRPVFPARPQPRISTPSVPCRTSTATIHASVPCRTSTATIPAQCSLPDLNRDHPRPVFPAGPQPEYPRQVFPAGPHVGRYVR